MFSSDEEEKSDSELENLKDYESDSDGDSNSDEETLGENSQEEEGHQVWSLRALKNYSRVSDILLYAYLFLNKVSV